MDVLLVFETELTFMLDTKIADKRLLSYIRR